MKNMNHEKSITNLSYLVTLFVLTAIVFQNSIQVVADSGSSDAKQNSTNTTKGAGDHQDDEHCNETDKSGNKTGGCQNNNATKLVMVQVIFRHGDRTPLMSWPKDPHHHTKSNNSIAQLFQRRGMLTKRGKVQAHELGTFLQHRYKEFLGQATWIPEDIHVQSSEVERAIMTAQCCLAGLFPPQSCTEKEPGGCEGRWSRDIKWQPIPVYTIPSKSDHIINFQREKFNCDAYNKELNKFINCGMVQEFIKKHSKVFDELKEHTGLPVVNIQNVGLIYDTLYIQSLYELPLPNWTKPYYPNPLKEMSELSFLAISATRKMLRFNGGPLLREVIDNMKRTVVSRCPFRSKEMKKKGRPKKLYLYSGHDNTVSAFLSTLNLLQQHQPAYTAAVIVELHEPLKRKTSRFAGPQDYTVKIFYRNATRAQPQEMIIPACGNPCHLDKLEAVSKDLFVSNWESACDGWDGSLGSWLMLPWRLFWGIFGFMWGYIKRLIMFGGSCGCV